MDIWTTYLSTNQINIDVNTYLISLNFPYPNSSFSTSQFFLVDFVIFVEGFLTCSISLAMMYLFACNLVSVTWCKICGSGSSKLRMSLTENKRRQVNTN